MRGVKAVLYVAVLVCLISSSFAQCGPHGKVSNLDSTTCLCQSGYYHDNQCTVSPDLGLCTAAPLSATEANHFPSLSTDTAKTTFVSNILHATIEAEYVDQRQYEELTFSGASNMACNLGYTGSYWTPDSSKVGANSCNDSFDLALPWNMHQTCGFANNTKKSDGEFMYITGYLQIRYTDQLGEVENFTLTRSTKVPYSITVKFQRHVTVQLKALNVSSDVKYGLALTEDVYDPTVSILTLEVTTIVNWPNMFFQGNDYMHIYMPDQVQMLTVNEHGQLCSDAAAAPACCTQGQTPAADSCSAPTQTWAQVIECETELQDSICKQTFTWKAMILTGAVKNCTFDGEYNLEIGLYTCRVAGASSAPDCTNQKLNITYTIQDSFVCGEIGVTPSVGGDLYAFSPTVTGGFRALVDAHQYINQFSLGTYGNFYAYINSEDNLISLNFTSISFRIQGQDITLAKPLYTSSAATGVTFQSQYCVVHDQSKFFNVYFHSSIFQVAPNSQVVYTFTATADIAFQGNDGYVANNELKKKRTVEFSWTQAAAEASTNVFMAHPSSAPKQVEETPAGVSSVTFIASVVGAVAGTMIIVFVVVGFALRARSGKEEVHASLLAASAAASEVANRA